MMAEHMEYQMPRSIRSRLAVLLPLALVACAPEADGPDQIAYLTLIGSDTLTAEWIEFGDGYVEAQALVRGSRTTWSEYRLDYDDAGAITGWQASTFEGAPGSTEPTRIESMRMTETGAELVVTQNGEERTSEFSAEPGEVPFIDMLHWPFELAFRRQAEDGMLGAPVATFSGRGMTFEVDQNTDGTLAVIHPSRGPSTATVDESGHIMALDGTGSTRAYQLSRTTWDQLNRDEYRSMFGDRPLGELSGRGEIDETVSGVRFTGDYGTPQRRDREIFGNLVAYGARWRTGANRATHLSFDQDLVIDGQTVPAGDYTLYTIPEEDGGVLIINQQTGQTGTTYDEARDQIRAQMQRGPLDSTVEVFEIEVVPTDGGGRIELRWQNTVYFVPFTVG